MAKTAQLPQPVDELPISPVAGLEPLLTRNQLIEWTGYSRSTIVNYVSRVEDPLPEIGTAALPRYLPSAVVAWMERQHENERATAAR